MNLYFRFFWMLLTRWVLPWKPLGLLDQCPTTFIVNPMDMDLNFHMNNGRYLSVMDLARTDLMIKSKTFLPLFSKGYYPVVVSQSIRFRRSLNFLDRFEVRSKMEGWNDRDFYVSQEFWKGSSLIAEGFIKGRFKKRGQNGSVVTSEIFRVVGMTEAAVRQGARTEALDRMEGLLAAKQTSIS